jgi:hypothetical protein
VLLQPGDPKVVVVRPLVLSVLDDACLQLLANADVVDEHADDDGHGKVRCEARHEKQKRGTKASGLVL